jgi:predicted ribosome quality control (RQC) complex YloA/Tae2 family protein
MTTEELTLYVALQEKFERSVDHVTTILSKIPKYKEDFYTYDKVWLDTSEDDFGEVNTEGSDYYSAYHGHFDAEMLTWSDEKLEKYVDSILDKYKRDEEKQKQLVEEAERKEYERLKQKFG